MDNKAVNELISLTAQMNQMNNNFIQMLKSGDADYKPKLTSHSQNVNLYLQRLFQLTEVDSQIKIQAIQLVMDYISFLSEIVEIDKNYFFDDFESVTNRLKNEIEKIKLEHLDLSILNQKIDYNAICCNNSLKSHLKMFELYTYGQLLQTMLLNGRIMLLKLQKVGIKSIMLFEENLIKLGLLIIIEDRHGEVIGYDSVYKPFVIYQKY